jgi:ATP-binding cassette subfamily F protein uup
VSALMAMREERAARRATMGNVRLQVERADPSGRLVFEAKHVTKSYGGHVVVRDFSTRILRGDRVGLIGSNGAGKTTLLRLLLGEIAPEAGEVRRGANVQVVYYDQQREQLDPERTVFETVGDGNETITANGQTRHVYGYLRDFLFSDERSRSPVKTLSGGERNRLLLARLFTRPANVVVLDEPTNDLDLETLEMLESRLVDWPGTLLLVSHDRIFLDHVVSSTVAFEGDGRIVEYVGGYEDWLRQRPSPASSADSGSRSQKSSHGAADTGRPKGGSTRPAARKLSYNEQRELQALPKKIEALEIEQAELHAKVNGSSFYKDGTEGIAQTLARLAAVGQELLEALARWDELDSRQAGTER